MKYIIFENKQDIIFGWQFVRTELKSDKELKTYLFKNRNNLSNIEIFNKSNKCEVNIDIKIK